LTGTTSVAFRPLFVTRKFPPSVGGMETLSFSVWRTLHSAAPEARLVAHGGSNRSLPLWLPVALVRVLAACMTRRVHVVLTGDAVVYTVLAPLLRLCRVPHATMVMGLDLTWQPAAYRAVVHPALRRAPLVVAISQATAQAARSFGVPAERLRVVRLGVEAPDVPPEERRRCAAELRQRLGLSDRQLVLLTVGRLVRRKGMAWFVDEVLPHLPEHLVYVLAGDGEDRTAVEEAVRRRRLDGRVRLLGQVDDPTREMLFRGADLFVQPNIPVAGDMEGFGLVTIEAAMRGLPVVASRLEGIEDAVVDGSTGLLLPTADADTWRRETGRLVHDRERLGALGRTFAVEARERYGLQQMGVALGEMLRQLVRDAPGAGPSR
jgi:glycosyltransferase involved in cell wall biosynthesis